jgi:hypothetical protein
MEEIKNQSGGSRFPPTPDDDWERFAFQHPCVLGSASVEGQREYDSVESQVSADNEGVDR